MVQLDFRLCGECGGCVAVCPAGVLKLRSHGLEINHELCTLCESCVIFCPTGALQIKSDGNQASLSSRKVIGDSRNGRQI
jgi:NAD-dependent dihydropyrimidine dehydrogenase PreA subunit